MDNVVAAYCVVVGTLMVAWWANALRTGVWNRSDRTHGELALHLVAEFATAAVLVAAGIALLVAPGAEPFAATALGMLLYTTIASPGYFLARGELPIVAMFGVLAVLTCAAIVTLLV